MPVTPAGHVIGDMIIFREREDKFILVGRAPTANWVQFQQAIGKWNVACTVIRARRSRPDGKAVYRTHYRFQIQGPDAPKVFEKMNGGPVPDVQVLPYRLDQCRLQAGAGAAPRHGRRAGPRNLGPL